MRKSGGVALAASLAAGVAFGGSADAADKIKVGFFSTLEGTYTALGEDGQRGFDLALMQHHNKAGGKELEVVRGSSDASPDSALRAAKKLVEQDSKSGWQPSSWRPTLSCSWITQTGLRYGPIHLHQFSPNGRLGCVLWAGL